MVKIIFMLNNLTTIYTVLMNINYPVIINLKHYQ